MSKYYALYPNGNLGRISQRLALALIERYGISIVYKAVDSLVLSVTVGMVYSVD